MTLPLKLIAFASSALMLGGVVAAFIFFGDSDAQNHDPALITAEGRTAQGPSAPTHQAQQYTAPFITPSFIPHITWHDNTSSAPSSTPSPDVIKEANERISQIMGAITKDWAVKVSAATLATSTGPVTQEDVFRILWPASYREDLQRIEDIMVQEKFLREDQRRSFTIENEIFDFYADLLIFMKNRGEITQEEHANFTRGVQTILPPLIQKEREALVRGLNISSALPGGQRLSRPNSLKKTAKDLLNGLAHVFKLAEPANALWFGVPSCYKDDVPFYPVPGPNLIGFCCNCGYFCASFGCTFLPWCGNQSVFCNVPVGCLNLVCRTWPNAIWDPTTGICGCG